MIGEKLVKLPEVDSTNNYARGLAVFKSAEEGTAVLAYSQLSGRGQGESSWESEPGKNLTVSYILYPDFLNPGFQFYISMIASLSAIEFFGNYTPDVKIKWPNDIYTGNKKIGGILIENSFLGNEFEFTIIGFGLNINQEVFLSGAPNPVSLLQLTGKIRNIETCFRKLSVSLDYWYLQLKKGKLDLIDLEYSKNLFRSGIWADYLAGGRLFKGKIVEVDETGNLIIQDENGFFHAYKFKEVEYIL